MVVRPERVGDGARRVDVARLRFLLSQDVVRPNKQVAVAGDEGEVANILQLLLFDNELGEGVDEGAAELEADLVEVWSVEVGRVE